MRRTTPTGAAALTALFVLALIVTAPVWAQVPGEALDLTWCPGTKDCLTWSAADGATSYNVYLGFGQDLAGLLDGAVDSCMVGSFSGTTANPVPGDPASGALDWFLVTAANASGEGSPGQGSSGPRVLDSSGACAVTSGLVLNEVDYDQPGTDFDEFVEIYNGGTDDRDLADLALIFVNGLSGFEYARAELSEAGSVLPPGGYLVVGSASVVATLPAGTLSVTLPSSSNNIQNGAPDGLALFDTATLTLLDALSYEGSITNAQFDFIPGTYNLVEGSPATAQDSNSVAGSLIRFPDGTDTDQAAADWHFVAISSAGASNPEP